jgi:hypothetical protein
LLPELNFKPFRSCAYIDLRVHSTLGNRLEGLREGLDVVVAHRCGVVAVALHLHENVFFAVRHD